MLFCNSFRREFSPCQSWFAVQEGEDDKPLNVADTFGGVDGLKMGLLKLVLTLFVLGTQVYTYVGSDNLYFYYFAYFSSWGMLWSVLYMLLSLCNSAFDLPQPQPSFKTTDVENDNDKENLQIISIRAKITWIFATLALLTGSTETIIYWTLVYEMGDDVSYLDLAPHGLVFLVVTIDAFHLNRIPLRWMHLWMVWGFTLSFICWSFLQGPLAFDIDNPDQEDDDPDTNDDAIYANLSWQSDDITKTVIFSLSVTFILQPILFSILRVWSRGSWLRSSCCCSGQQDRLFYVADGSNGDAFSRSGDDSEVFSNPRGVEMVHANSSFPSCSAPIVCCW